MWSGVDEVPSIYHKELPAETMEPDVVLNVYDGEIAWLVKLGVAEAIDVIVVANSRAAVNP